MSDIVENIVISVHANKTLLKCEYCGNDKFFVNSYNCTKCKKTSQYFVKDNIEPARHLNIKV